MYNEPSLLYAGHRRARVRCPWESAGIVFSKTEPAKIAERRRKPCGGR